MKIKLLILLWSLVSIISLKGQILDLPLDNQHFKPIWEVKDPKLSQGLKSIMASNKQWQNLVDAKKMCVGVVDISNPRQARYAAINENTMLYAASLPKIAILLATFDAIDKGEIELTCELDSLMHNMIRVSSNSASTALIDMVGYDRIANVLQDKNYQLYNLDKKGGLWVGKRYAAGGQRNPDPLLGLSHAATVSQVCRFYYLLAYGKLISRQRSKEMLEYLIDPHLHHKFVFTLDKIAPEADIYRKSGTWKQYHADSVMVIGDEWRSYIVVALIESPSGEMIMRDLLKQIDDLLHNYKNNKL